MSKLELDCRLVEEGLIGLQKIVVIEQIIKKPNKKSSRYLVASVLAEIDSSMSFFNTDPFNLELSKKVADKLQESKRSTTQ